MLMLQTFGDDTPATPPPLSTADAFEVAALIFNNRNAQITDAVTTATLRGKSVSEQDIANGFAMANGASLATQWAKDPNAEGVQFAVATIENDLRLGATVPTIITLLRAKAQFDARLTESVIAEGFREVQIKRTPPPPPPSSPTTGISSPILWSLAVAGVAAAAGVTLLVRRKRSRALGADYDDDGPGDVPDVRRIANFLDLERKRRDQKLVKGTRVTVTGAPRVRADIDCGPVIGPGGEDGTYVVKHPKTGVLYTIAARNLKRC